MAIVIQGMNEHHVISLPGWKTSESLENQFWSKVYIFKTNNKSVKQTTDKNLREASLFFPLTESLQGCWSPAEKRQWITLNLSVLLDICRAISSRSVVLSPLMDLSSAQHEHHSNWSPVEKSASTDGFSQRNGHAVMAVPAQCFMAAYCPFIYWNLISFSMSQLSSIFTRDVLLWWQSPGSTLGGTMVISRLERTSVPLTLKK